MKPAGKPSQKFFYILLLSVLIFSCQKDQEEEPLKEEPLKDQITTGNLPGMILNQNIIQIEGGFNSFKTIALDLNDNAQDDLEISMGYGSSPGMGSLYYVSQINLLHPGIELLHYSSTDTTYKKVNISYRQGDGVIIEEIIKWYNCYKPDPFYQIDKIEEKNHLMALEAGQIVLKSDNFINQNVSFIYSTYFEGFDTNGDTIFLSTTYRTYDCHKIPKQVDLYLVFKLDNHVTERLGWIKMNLGSTVKATILQIGIQE
jgi:hypothetical protein